VNRVGMNIVKLRPCKSRVCFCKEIFESCVRCECRCTREIGQYQNFPHGTDFGCFS
jgi:hypothetical protein